MEKITVVFTYDNLKRGVSTLEATGTQLLSKKMLKKLAKKIKKMAKGYR